MHIDGLVTLRLAILDSATGELDIVNAGHNPAIIIRNDGNVEQIEAGGIGLGMLDFGIPYEGTGVKLNAGDKLFLYTDGIPEAMNHEEEEYSDERMINFLKTYSINTPAEFIAMLVEDVKNHAGSAQQSDDITCLFLARKK